MNKKRSVYIKAVVLIAITFVMLCNTVTAAAEQSPYLIEFDANGGTVNGQEMYLTEPIEYMGELYIAEVDDPKKKGFLFDGWECGSMPGELLYPGDSLYADDFVEDEIGWICRLKAIWSEDPEFAEKPAAKAEGVQTVDIYLATEAKAYSKLSDSDIIFCFPNAKLDQFSGFGLDFDTSAEYNVDYTVFEAEGGVYMVLSADYLTSLEAGNHTAVLYFCRNNPNPCGAIGLADFTVK